MRLRHLQNFGGPAAEYVSLLGTVQDKDIGTTTTLAFTGVAVGADESIFVGVGAQLDATVFSLSDNLGNTYTLESYANGSAIAAAVWAAIPTIPGTINQIDLTYTPGVPVVVVAARFRNIGAAISSTQESNTGPNDSTPNDVLLTAGPSDGIGISCYAIRSTGSVVFNSPAVLVGYDSTAGGADSSNVDSGLGYVIPVTSSGMSAIGLADNTRAWAHAGKQYAAA